MSIDIKYVPLTFIKSDDEILRQIKNTVYFSFLFSQFEETTLNHYLESTQYGYTASASSVGTHHLLRITDINNGHVDWQNVPFCNCDSELKYLLKDEDILIARTGGTTGKSFIVNDVPSNAIFASYLIRLRLKKGVDIQFINCFLNSYTFWSQIIEMKSGSAMPNVNAEKLKTLKLPKCDLDTQQKVASFTRNEGNEVDKSNLLQKIVSVESIFKTGNNISTELNHQLDLVKQLRQSFLQEAMHGKLTGMLADNEEHQETGQQLLKKIKAQKAQLTKDKKLKKEKELPSIKPEEIPFEIPQNWVWCRLGEVGNLKRGKSKHRPRNDKRLFHEGHFPFIQTGDVSKAKSNNDLITTINGYYNDFGLSQSEIQKAGTLCITIAANIAECGFLSFDACVPDSVVCFLGAGSSVERYVYYYLKIAKAHLEKFAPATAQKNINLGILNYLLIPLPSEREIILIVERLEALLKNCDHLEISIKQSQQLNGELLQQVLREALEVETNDEREEKVKIIKLPILQPEEDFYYQKRKALATYILNQSLSDPWLGDTKLMKLLHLADYHAIKRNLGQKFYQKAAGPFDNGFIYPFFEEIKSAEWFKRVKKDGRFYFSPGANHSHSLQADPYFSQEELNSVDQIIAHFKTDNYERPEIISTLYAVWNNRIINGVQVSDELLKQDFLDWDAQKAKYKRRLDGELRWMRDKGIVPDGWGKLIDKPKALKLL